VAVGVFEIKASAAIEVIDLTTPVAVEVGIKYRARVSDTRERRVEFLLTDEEGVVPTAELGGLREVERDAVTRADRDEMRPFRPRLQTEDICEESGRPPFVLGGMIVWLSSTVMSSSQLPQAVSK